MKNSTYAFILILLIVSAVTGTPPTRAQTGSNVLLSSQYILNRYGYAIVNETIGFSNGGTTSVTLPAVSLGLGNLSSRVVSYNLTGGEFKLAQANGGLFAILGGQSLAAGAEATFALKVLLSNVWSKAANGSLQIQVLLRPSVNVTVKTLRESIRMPALTEFETNPSGLTSSSEGNLTQYSANFTNPTTLSAVTQLKTIKQAAGQDFHPLVVYLAERTISVSSNLSPVVTDEIEFENLGTTNLRYLYVSPLTTPSSKVTVIPPPIPHLLNPASTTLRGDDAIDLATSAVGSSVGPNVNLTVSYQYLLPQKYYHSSGGQITLQLPTTAPITSLVSLYVVKYSLPSGVKVIQGPPPAYSNVEPISWQVGTIRMSYSLSIAWALGDGIPIASAIFFFLLIGLFVSKTTMSEEEETEEESSTERASAMIKAFDDKTGLINSIWPEVSDADPNELSGVYFDEIRGRLDAFRTRALQRLNEVKQKSTTQKFFDLLNQIHTTEREVDKAAKDKLNLYEQYYTRKMRKEVFERLLPQYTRRLEKALNELSDELHVVQREAKLL